MTHANGKSLARLPSGIAGLDAILKNIDAVKELSMITRTSLGPNGAFLSSLLFLN